MERNVCALYTNKENVTSKRQRKVIKTNSNIEENIKNHAFVVFNRENINCNVMVKTYTRNCHANKELR